MTKKRFLLALALMLTGVGGAWAQTYNVTFAANNNTVTVENVTLPHTFSCSYSEGNGELDLIIQELYGLTGSTPRPYKQSTPTATGNSNVTADRNGRDHYITISAAYEGNATVSGQYEQNLTEVFTYSLTISVAEYVEPGTPVATGTPNQWHLTVPAGNVTLTVDYYGQYTLDSVPLDWQVKIGNNAPVSPTAYTTGNTQLGYVADINETDSVELIPPAALRESIKAVRLTEVVPIPPLEVSLGGVTFYYMEGDTWAQALARPENTGSTITIVTDEMSGVRIRNGNQRLRSSCGSWISCSPTATIEQTMQNYSIGNGCSFQWADFSW